MTHREKAKTGNIRPPKKRPTIGLLTPATADEGGYMQTVIAGVVSFAEEKDANLICFVGDYLYHPGYTTPEAQANVIYNLASPESIDGMVVMASLGNFSSGDRLAELCERYRPLPLACAGMALDGFPSVLVDNEPGMRDLVAHIIEVHGCHRIAFIRGAEGSPDTEARFRAYTEVLAEHGIPLDPDLIAPGSYHYGSGKEAVALLLDERKIEFDALMASNDEMAIGALDVLQARGIEVPGTVALTGFDDLQEGRFTIPPLTTVVQPVHDVGWRAAELMWAQMHDEEVPDQLVLPTRVVVVRQSCGCLSTAALQAVAGPVVVANGLLSNEPLVAALAARRETILSEMAQTGGAPAGSQDAARIAQLLDSFIAEMDDPALSGTFLVALDELLRRSQATDRNVDTWQEVMSVLRRLVAPCLANDTQTLSRAEDIWHQARVAIGEAAARVQAHQALRVQREIEIQRQIGQTLITTFDIDRLMDVLAENLPRLNIPSAYLSLYEDPQPYEYPQPVPEWSQLMLAYNEVASSNSRRVRFAPEGLRFPSQQLAPEGMLPSDRRYTYVVEALHFGRAQLGFCLFEMGAWRPQRGENVYDILSGQIASAIQGSRLFQAHGQAEAELEKAYAEVEQQARELERSNAELEQFAYIASHDLQEPLRMVSSYLQLIERRYKSRLDQEADEFIAFAVDGATRMQTLINDLLTYSRVGTHSNPIEPTDCATILESTLANLKIAIEESHAVVTHDPMPTVMADDVQLGQVFQNLIGNAIKFRKKDTPPEVHIGVKQRDGTREFSVRDNGIGVDPRHFERIFMIFQRLHRHQDYPGTGIGLAVTKKIIERHGGRMWVESEPGKGTTFFFTLPAVP